jgi:hypothetical protein
MVDEHKDTEQPNVTVAVTKRSHAMIPLAWLLRNVAQQLITTRLARGSLGHLLPDGSR